MFGLRLERIKIIFNIRGVFGKLLVIIVVFVLLFFGFGVSKIDKYVRIFFLVIFGVFNMVYWVVYLSKDIMEKLESLMWFCCDSSFLKDDEFNVECFFKCF